MISIRLVHSESVEDLRVDDDGRLSDQTIAAFGEGIHHTDDTRPQDEVNEGQLRFGQVAVVKGGFLANAFY